MRRLMLLRHAKTEKDSPTGLDRDRRLDARGRAEAPQLGRYMAQHGFVPEVALVSPAMRTRETAVLLGGELSPQPNVVEVTDLYGADPDDLLRVLQDEAPPGAKSIIIVAHNPGIHEFALRLMAPGSGRGEQPIDAFPPASLAVLDFAVDGWAKVGPGRGRLVRFVNPRMLGQGGS